MPVKTVALFVTCLVDFFRPAIGFAAVRLLEARGYQVTVPPQSCCGQPAYNSGDRDRAISVARQFIERFSGFDAIVVPSGSCGSMIARHLPTLVEHAGDRELSLAAIRIADRTFELSQFLAHSDAPDAGDQPEVEFARRVTYHDSCSGLRELEIHDEPRALLEKVSGLELVEYAGANQCCGFGGTFCVKYSEISTTMCQTRCGEMAASGAEVLLGGDLGCLLNLAGGLKRSGSDIEVRHWAEVAAGLAELPAIGEPEG